MKHYSCDVCGRALAGSEPRFKAYIYIEPAEILEEDEEFDLSEDMFEDLDRLEDMLENVQPGYLDEYEEHRFIFDMCEECKEKYLADPLFRKKVQTEKMPFRASRN